MSKIIINLATALLFAVIITELFTRFLPTQYWGLLVVSAIALFINGMINARIATQSSSNADQNNQQSRSDNNKPAERKNTRPRNDRKRDTQPVRSEGSRGRERNKANNRNNPRQDDDGQNGSRPARDSGRERNHDANRGAEQAVPEKPNGPTEEGEVKWFNRSKGYGFVIRENGDEIFVHQRSIVPNASDQGERRQRPILQDGQRVSFVVSEHEKGVQAEYVQTVD